MEVSQHDKVVVDLDGTITIDDKDSDYPSKPVNERVKKAVRAAQQRGYGVTIFTARNMRTYEGDIEKILEHTKPVAEEWLRNHNVPYDQLQFGKPWCGPHGFYVDDKALHPEEFCFKFDSALSDSSFDVVVSFYNEGAGVHGAHDELSRVLRYLNVKNFIYVDNCSKDTTHDELIKLQRNDGRVKVLRNEQDLGYGNGYKRGIEAATADFVFMNHGDAQFCGYQFIRLNETNLAAGDFESVFPLRLNRPFTDSFLTRGLRIILSMINLRVVPEFNGQPKIFRREIVQPQLSEAPNDFCFDYWLWTVLKNTKLLRLPTLQKPRLVGESTWNRGWQSRLKLAKRYLSYAIETARKARA